VADLLTAGGLPTHLEPDIQAAIWSKAIFNATMNTLCALTRRTPGFLGAHEESRALIRTMVLEGTAAANASGIALDAQPILDLTEVSITDHADHEASMLQDVKAGRRTEVDAINGAIVRAARAAGVATPVTETLLRLVKLEEAKLG
jgi:2-dehydropantoate 2-reductase